MFVSLGGLQGDVMLQQTNRGGSPKAAMTALVASQFGKTMLDHPYQTQDNPFEPFSRAVDKAAAEALAVNDKGPAVLVGSSVGGGMALNMAPKLVAGGVEEVHLVLFASIHDIPVAAHQLMMRDGGGKDAPAELMAGIRDKIDLGVSGAGAGVYPFTKTHAEDLANLYSFFNPNAPRGAKQFAEDMKGKLASVQIIVATEDGLSPPKAAQALLAMMPCPDSAKRIIEIPGGHNDANNTQALERLEILREAVTAAAIAAHVRHPGFQVNPAAAPAGNTPT